MRMSRDSGGSRFVDQAVVCKSLDREGPSQFVGSTDCDRVRQQKTPSGYRLKSAGSPSAVDEEIANGRRAEDR